MTTLTLDKAYQTVGDIAGSFPHYGHKTIKSIQKVICVTTDEKSAKFAKEILSEVLEIKNDLPTNSDVTIEELKENLNKVNNILTKVKEVLSTLNYYFHEKHATFEIDDDNMITFMNSFNDAADELLYISDYLTLAIQAQKSKLEIKEGKFQKFTLEELISLIKAA